MDSGDDSFTMGLDWSDWFTDLEHTPESDNQMQAESSPSSNDNFSVLTGSPQDSLSSSQHYQNVSVANENVEMASLYPTNTQEWYQQQQQIEQVGEHTQQTQNYSVEESKSPENNEHHPMPILAPNAYQDWNQHKENAEHQSMPMLEPEVTQTSNFQPPLSDQSLVHPGVNNYYQQMDWQPQALDSTSLIGYGTPFQQELQQRWNSHHHGRIGNSFIKCSMSNSGPMREGGLPNPTKNAKDKTPKRPTLADKKRRKEREESMALLKHFEQMRGSLAQFSGCPNKVLIQGQIGANAHFGSYYTDGTVNRVEQQQPGEGSPPSLSLQTEPAFPTSSPTEIGPVTHPLIVQQNPMGFQELSDTQIENMHLQQRIADLTQQLQISHSKMNEKDEEISRLLNIEAKYSHMKRMFLESDSRGTSVQVEVRQEYPDNARGASDQDSDSDEIQIIGEVKKDSANVQISLC